MGQAGRVRVEDRAVSYSGQDFSLQGEKGRFVLPAEFRKTVKTSSGGERILCLAKHDRWNCLTGFGLSREAALQVDWIAVAEPVVVGIRFIRAERARRMSLAGRSTMVWVLVTSWIVVIEP